MARSTCTLFIGVFSVALYLMMSIFLVLFTFFMNTVSTIVAEDEDTSAETKYAVTGISTFVTYLAYIMLAYNIIMVIVSMFMIYGIQKDRYQCITPWLCLTAIGVIAELIDVFFEIGDKNEYSAFFNFIAAVLTAAMWYPVFRYHQYVKCPKAVVATNACPSTVAPEFSHVNAKFVPTSFHVSKV